jgi:hypothetical protein
VPFTLVIATLALAAEGTRSWGALAPVAMLAAIGVSGSAKALTHLDLRIDRVRHGLEKLDDFSCERDATLWMAAHASSIAETDFQRAKLFADELTVVDLMGLNDRKRAHEHEPGRDLWGKGGFRDAAASNAEILVLGPLAPGATPMAGFTTRTVVDSPRLSKELLGQPFPPETRDDLVSHYVTASIPRTCGGYLNVFVRADRAADLARGGAIVGRAE